MELQIKEIIISAENSIEGGINETADSTDVIVLTNNQEVYFAPFFTFSKINNLRNTHSICGDFLNGKYFWEEKMVLVESCSNELIIKVIDDIIEEGNFYRVFKIL